MDIKKLIKAPFLVMLGLFLVFAAQAAFIGGFLSVLAGIAPYGALLIVIGTIMEVIGAFK